MICIKNSPFQYFYSSYVTHMRPISHRFCHCLDDISLECPNNNSLMFNPLESRSPLVLPDSQLQSFLGIFEGLAHMFHKAVLDIIYNFI